jgi:hypothetical protein
MESGLVPLIGSVAVSTGTLPLTPLTPLASKGTPFSAGDIAEKVTEVKTAGKCKTIELADQRESGMKSRKRRLYSVYEGPQCPDFQLRAPDSTQTKSRPRRGEH